MQREAADDRFMVTDLHAAGYRSLRAVRVAAGRLTVFVGANGTGKTNLYRSLQLLQASAAGTLSRELAAEGGMEAVLWAGERRAGQPARLTLSVGFGEAGAAPAYSYEVTAGLTSLVVPDAFPLEPQIKEETLTFHHRGRRIRVRERRGPAVFARDTEGHRSEIGQRLLGSETALGACDEPGRYPEPHLVRRAMLDWRFYHALRTDAEAPVRRPCLAVTSRTLASDGSDLAAVFATIVHIRNDTAALDAMIARAFPGSVLRVPAPGRTASVGMIFPDHPRRVFDAAELSDGTLRYLLLAGALMSSRLPAFIALNEPESSLHPDLLEPLAELIVAASRRTQVWLVTHSEALAEGLGRHGGVRPRIVITRDGATWICGTDLAGDPDE